jgi:hypothetical protein
MSTTQCPCGKRDCPGISHHDNQADRRLSDFWSNKQDRSTDLDLRGETSHRLETAARLLAEHRPYCSPALQARIDGAISSGSPLDDIQGVYK